MRAQLIAGLVFASVMISDETWAQLPDLTGGYLCNGRCAPGNACAMIDQNGVELTIVDPQGRQGSGRLLSNSEIEFIDLVGVIDDQSASIAWDNDTIWIRTTLCPSP
ncbi:MAG: hypothetical protein OEU92_30790 [Alphaproteobacteria bacterium]|nr:hypothetical protein [Alphaproteobacteria bacterium]